MIRGQVFNHKIEGLTVKQTYKFGKKFKSFGILRSARGCVYYAVLLSHEIQKTCVTARAHMSCKCFS